MWSKTRLLSLSLLVVVTFLFFCLWQPPLSTRVNADNQLRPVTQTLVKLQNIQQIDVGRSHTCALVGASVGNGGVKCWGGNEFGQLGDTTLLTRTLPVDVSTLTSGVKFIATGSVHTCALTSNGGVKCWGNNSGGQLGDGSFVNRTSPVSVSSLTSGVLTVVAGDEHTCVLLNNNSVKCWGNNGHGQLGNSSTQTSTTPVNVTGLNSGVAAITAGGRHTCALLTDQTIRCWGDNSRGQIGNGTTTDQPTPVSINGVSGFIAAISAGNTHTCAINLNGGVECWGNNHIGQLGIGTITPDYRTVPGAVPSLTTGIAKIDVGIGDTCVVTTGATVICWGSNAQGQLGIGSTVNQLAPVAVPNLMNVNKTAVGDGTHTCTLLIDGTAKCSGDNHSGQLGDNTRTDRHSPVDVLVAQDPTPTKTPTPTPTITLTTTPPRPDLTVVSTIIELETGASCDYTSTQLGVRVTVRNIGIAAAGPFVVEVNGQQKQVSEGLTAGATTTVWFPGGVMGDNTATVDATGQIFESNESNNTLTQFLPIPTLPPTCTPTATPTNTATPTPTVDTPTGADAFEDNDTCAQAAAIASDGKAQQLTIHKTADVDWMRFEATANTDYRIEVQVPSDSPADLDLAVHTSCTDLPADSWNAGFSPDVRLDFTAPAMGPIYLRLTNYDATVAGSHVRYNLSVRPLEQTAPSRALIIVAGRLKGGDRLQANIHNVTQTVYELFQANGYDNDQIRYLATDSSLPGYTAAATEANLRAAITTWAAEQLTDNGVLTLYMIDHGKPDLFFLDDLSNQRVTPDELDSWLADLESQVPNLTINVIIEACQSGSFIQTPSSLSKTKRLIITSTNATNDAKASIAGAYFSDHFLTGLYQGFNLYSSFYEARRVAQEVFALQEAWVDGDGDGQPNEFEDAAVAASRGFNYPGTFDDPWPPHIFTVETPATISNASGRIAADVRDDGEVDQVWGVVYSPSYTPPAVSEELLPEVLPTFLFAKVGNNQFAADYTGFTEAGVYKIVIHAEDKQGLKARPVVIEVNNGQRLYLPIVTK